MRVPNIRRPSLDLVQGDDISSLLYEMAQSLDIGRPDGWEKLMNAPNITGSHAIEPAHPSELRHVVGTWGLNDEMFEDAYRDIYKLVETAIADGVFITQGFVYNSPKCGDVPRPVCLSTLVVVAQIQYLIGNHVYQIRLGHFYLASSAETIQQKEPRHWCHSCKLVSRCCHDEMRNRDLTLPELDKVKAVLSTHQSEWAIQQLLTRFEMSFGQQEISVPLSGSQIETRFKPLLKHFISNTDENKDAQFPQTDDLLQALQNTARMTQQSLRAKHMTVPETRIDMVLEMLLKSCFEHAGIQESVSEWWERAYATSNGSPISVECEFFDQEREPLDPSVPECFVGSNVTSQTLYSWGLIQEHDVTFDVLFLENDLAVNYVECAVTNKPTDNVFARHLHLSLNPPTDKTAGSNVRTASARPDGSFHDVEFLAQWSRYSVYVDKVALDLLRLAACASFLGMRVPQYSREVAATTMVVDPSFTALMSSIQLFAKTWKEVVQAFGSSTSETVQRKVCLGFDALNYTVDTKLLGGIREDVIPDVIDLLARQAVLPANEELQLALKLVVFSENFTWVSQGMKYVQPTGEASFAYLGKYGNAVDHRTKIVFSQVHSNFELAKDMLIVHQHSSVLGGMFTKDRTIIEYVPHTMTLNDTLILQMFWQMMSYHQVVMSLGEQPPGYPDLSFLCDRTIP
ncbi:hypothetical protein BG005_000089 [Podila minutissima]|nr:hypothetical protein BG005_000089 [Podila minutissima]